MTANTDTLTPVEVLREARALIETPEHWTRDYYARTPEGEEVDVDDPHACSWCSIGAIMRVSQANYPLASQCVLLLNRVLPNRVRESGYGAAAYNDDATTTHRKVLRLYDRAIALAEAEAK